MGAAGISRRCDCEGDYARRQEGAEGLPYDDASRDRGFGARRIPAEVGAALADEWNDDRNVHRRNARSDADHLPGSKLLEVTYWNLSKPGRLCSFSARRS